MLDSLLWRCPLCGEGEAIRQRRRWLIPDVVDCRACAARWSLRRPLGRGFHLRLEQASPAAPDLPAGTEMPLHAWYARVKQSAALTPLPVEALPPGAEALPDERLYLLSGAARLFADEGAGPGRMALTSARLLWIGADRVQVYPLERLERTFALVDAALAFTWKLPRLPMRRAVVVFEAESPLKWLTHLRLTAEALRAAGGRGFNVAHD